MNPIVITNNSLIWESMSGRSLFSGFIYDKNLYFEDILKKAEDMIKKGSKLLISPFFGNLPPYETPYKTLILSENGNIIDFYSLSLINHALQNARKLADERSKAFWNEKDLDYFKKGDLVIVERWLVKIYMPKLVKEVRSL